MIYGRFHMPTCPNVVTIVRRAVLRDVRHLDGRRPDETDRRAVELGSYVVVREAGGAERLYHVGYLRADGGWAEVHDAIEATVSSARLTRRAGARPAGPTRGVRRRER